MIRAVPAYLYCLTSRTSTVDGQDHSAEKAGGFFHPSSAFLRLLFFHDSLSIYQWIVVYFSLCGFHSIKNVLFFKLSG